MSDNRPQHHGDGESNAKADADKRHRLGAILLAGQIGKQCHYRGSDSAGALQRAAENDTPDRGGAGGDHAAQHKNQQAADDQRLAADAIGEQAERNLKNRLRQAINADGQANQRFAGALQRHAIGR